MASGLENMLISREEAEKGRRREDKKVDSKVVDRSQKLDERCRDEVRREMIYSISATWREIGTRRDQIRARSFGVRTLYERITHDSK